MENALKVAGFVSEKHRWVRLIGLNARITVYKNEENYSFYLDQYNEEKAYGFSATLLGGLEALQYQLECRGIKELARDVQGFAFAVKTLVPGAAGQPV